MWLLFTFLGVWLQILPSGEGSNFRIIAGRRASIVEFPYQADLEKMQTHFCGGSIIHKNFILTASHCVQRYSSLKPVPKSVLSVRVGNDEVQTGGTVYGISEIIPHEQYNDALEMDQYDIALLRLSTPLELSERVGIVSLAKNQPQPGELGWVTGFGKQEMMRSATSQKRHLMAVEVPVVSLEECRLIMEDVADDMICAGHKKGHRDACAGDSGGPYVVNDEQVGIVAWGIGCGREGLPGVYTNVAMYRDWIISHIKKYGDSDLLV